MSLDKKTAAFYPVPKLQPVAVLQQAAAVQNTWYTVLDTTKNCRLINVVMTMQTANEDLELRLTIDGVVWVGGQANAVAGTDYLCFISYYGAALNITTTDYSIYRAFLIEGRSVKVEIRKTSANGANRLDGHVIYQTW